jgi:CHAT domain-containing protein
LARRETRLSDPGAPSARETVDALLAVTGHRDRLTRLRQFVGVYSAELVEELRKSAEAALRRDPREAGRRAQLGLAVAEAIRDGPGRIACLIERAKADVLCGDAGLALASVEEASVLAREAGDAAAEARIELLRLQPLIALERYDEARTCGGRLLATLAQRGDDGGRILAHMALADLSFRVDQPREALAHYAEVDRLLPATAPQQARGALSMNRANALDACNRFRAAARQFDRAREFFRAAGAEHTVAQVDYNAAYGEFLRGRYHDALRRYAACEQVFRRLDDARHLAHIDLDRAEIHLHLNRPQDAALLAASAETRFLALGMAKERAQAVYFGACAAELRGDAAAATAGFDAAERLFRELGLAERVLASVVARARVAERQGDIAVARQIAASARDLLGERMNPLSKATVDLLLARLEYARGESSAAIAGGEEVLRTCRRIHAPWLQIEALRLIGRAHLRLGDTTPAIAAYRRAVDELERYRGGVPPDAYMASFLGGHSALYDEAMEALVAAGEVPAAFECAERAKSRALVEILAGRRERQRSTRDAGPLVQRLRHLRERLSAVYERLSRRERGADVRPEDLVDETRRGARSIEQAIAALLRRRRRDDREAASLEAGDAPDTAELRAALEPGTALVEYVVADRALYAFAVTRDEIHVARREVSRREVAHIVERCRYHLLRGRHAGTSQSDPVLCTTRDELAMLSDLLLEPIAASLAGIRRLVVVPHGELHHVPFHALLWNGGWVADAFDVVYAPSAAVYAFCGAARPAAKGGPAVFGLPDKSGPQVENECRRVARAIGASRLYLRDDATYSQLCREARRARIVHISIRGMQRNSDPMLTSLRLADRRVDLYDLYDLTVRGELVVLSSLEGDGADAFRADEIVGLTRGLLYAGARAVLTSRWAVDGPVPGRFMETFHRAVQSGDDVASAHRSAMAAIRAEHPHPYYWAPYFLAGCPAEARRPGAAPEAATAASGEPAPLVLRRTPKKPAARRGRSKRTGHRPTGGSNMRRAIRRTTLIGTTLLALAATATPAVNWTAMAQRYAAFQHKQQQKWLLTNTVSSVSSLLCTSSATSTVTGTVDRFLRYQIRVTAGKIDPTNTPMFGSDLAGRQAQLDTMIGISAAHATATGRDVVVAVLDSGFNLNHPWIASRVLPYGYDPVGQDWDPQDRGNGIDDDHDGYVDNGVGHGTFVSGMIVSVAPDAWILPVRIADDEGYGLEDELVSGIDFAISMGADVINISYEAGTLSPTICNKLQEAHDDGITVVVSGGNDGSDQVKTMAASGTTIAVGAVDWSDAIAPFSNTPSDGRGITLFAPGVDIYGPHGGPSNDTDCYWSGTSFSAPLATGAAALALEINHGLSPQQVRDRLLAASTVAVRAWDGTTYPYAGRIDLRRVVVP